MHIGQTKIAATVAEGKPLVVKPEQVQQRGVDVVQVHLVFHRRLAGLVSRAVAQPAAHAAGRNALPCFCAPPAEKSGVMVMKPGRF